MNLLNLAFLAPFVMAWSQLKQLLLRLSSALIVRCDLQGTVADHLHDILWKEWKPIPLGVKLFLTEWYGFKAFQGHSAPAVLSIYSGAVVFRKGLRFVVWHPRASGHGRLTCLRFNVAADQLVAQAATALYESTQQDTERYLTGSGFYVTHFQGENVSAKRGISKETSGGAPSGGDPASASPAVFVHMGVIPGYERYPMMAREAKQFGNSTDLPPLSRHYLDPQLDVIVQEITAWSQGRQWMRERGIAHRRGVLLEGPPGTGKSSLVEALAQHFNMRLIVVDLATCSDFDLPNLRAWAHTPSIFLFEDIDRIFEGTRNITEREVDKLTFDAFINLLSGVEPLEGLIFLTSNHPEKLEEALLRPGRVDRRIHVPLLSSEGRIALAHRILGDCGQEWIYRALEGAQDQPAAHFENTCIQLALEWYWKHSNTDTTHNDEQQPT